MKKRVTRRKSIIRKTILTLLETAHNPLSAPELVALLSSLGLPVNKTTVYRELQILQEEQLVDPVAFHPGKMLYESATVHHHHLVCTKCNTVIHMHDNGIETLISHYTKTVKKRYYFMISAHMIEFFGICPRCAKK
jgi:Fur family ferric uptake transcriptional regulator